MIGVVFATCSGVRINYTIAKRPIAKDLPKGGFGFVVWVAYDRVVDINGVLRECLESRRAFVERLVVE